MLGIIMSMIGMLAGAFLIVSPILLQFPLVLVILLCTMGFISIIASALYFKTCQ